MRKSNYNLISLSIMIGLMIIPFLDFSDELFKRLEMILSYKITWLFLILLYFASSFSIFRDDRKKESIKNV